jgi:hypothetical protein
MSASQATAIAAETPQEIVAPKPRLALVKPKKKKVIKPKALTKKDELVKLATCAELFCEPDGKTDRAFATVPVAEHLETYCMNSGEFRLWMTNEYYKRHGEVVSAQPMQDALNTLKAQAYFSGVKHRIFNRIGELNGKFYYDLGDAMWRVVEIDSNGWRILDNSPVKFVRSASYKSQVTPVKGGSIDELRPFINVSSEEDWILFAGWLIQSFRPTGPYHVLGLAGTQDAAKSTTTKLVRGVVDPSTVPVRSAPKEERDLMVGAKNNWLLAFDNLSYITESLSDAFCRLSTGGGQANRELYKNADEFVFDAMRPVVMNGIEELATRPDLADRTLSIFLPSIKDDERKDEKTLYTEYEAVLPRVLGAIFDALSVAIRNLPNTHIEKLPRMADAAKFVTAAEEALGWETGTFLQTCEVYRRTAKINGLEASNVGTAILMLMEALPLWEGPASELLQRLHELLPESISRKKFPSSARSMSSQLRRIQPNLKEAGIEVEMPEGVRRLPNGEVARLITITNTRFSESKWDDTVPF